MNTKIRKSLLLMMGLGLTATLAIVPQTFAADGDEVIEEVITIGTRRQARSAMESAAPVDVISGKDFVNQGDTDLTNLIRNVVPSYNVNTQPISDAASVVRPANLRGLAPDHTLVTVNGKRRHRASVIYWLGNGVADGAQGPDISTIPSLALKQVEVLRDGASAQYGSDAIAGVMNFVLKDDSEGGTVEAKYGQFYEGDGTSTVLSANIGTGFTENGFANFTVEYGNTDDTNRSVQREDALKLIADGNTNVADPVQIWGQPKISGDLKTFLNMGVDLEGNKEFYAFANYAEKEVDGGFYFRNPNNRGGVFTVNRDPDGIEDSGDEYKDRLVADVTGDSSGNCPTTLQVVDSGPGATISLADNDSQLADVIADPNCFVMNELFPGGFTPRFGGNAHELAVTAGVKGELPNGLLWDVSGSVGQHEVDFFIYNTVNASLGPQTPTSFSPGSQTQLDKAFNVDFSYPVSVASFYSDLNVAAGFEYREEQFQITAGDGASFEIGPYATDGFGSASNGFPGFSSLAAGVFDRENGAVYFDLEADVTERLLLGAAVRFEQFQGFGSTTTGKLSSHFDVNDSIALRSTVSTGFRAPTPGQINAFNVSTEFDLALNDLVNNGTIPSINPIAALRGGVELQPEESTNFTLGTILSLGEFNITLDYFNIELNDRITTSSLFSLDQDEIDGLVESGVTSAANLQNFRFFVNGFDTETKGFDLVASRSFDWAAGSTDVNLAYNQTKTEVTDFITPTVNGVVQDAIIDATRIAEMETGLPETRYNLSAVHSVGDWNLLARVSYYDEFFDSEDGQVYGDEYIVDAEASYAFNDKYTLSVGAQNLFDEFPDENPGAAGGVGNTYSQFSPSGFGGGYYYMRLRYEF